jgi:hypothetical protein
MDEERGHMRYAYPQKIDVKENIRFSTVPPVSATSIQAMTIFVNVEAKRRNAKMKGAIKAPCELYFSIKFIQQVIDRRVSKQSIGLP